MGLTTCELYRKGNATSARLDNVRPIDIEHFDVDGAIWVRAGTGGVSTFDVRGTDGGHWWGLAAGFDHGARLVVWNDAPNHWSWEPSVDMLLSEFRSLLGVANSHFR